jgi:hypothetical protein
MNVGSPKTIDVLANDSDPDNDPLVVTEVSVPENGTAVINLDNIITYTPSAGFDGTDAFTYTISDGNGGVDAAQVTVTVSSQSSETALYVYDIRFEMNPTRAGTYRAVFEIHADVDDDGAGNDSGAAGVAISADFGGKTYSGTTDSEGVFYTNWVKLKSGRTYFANVVDLVMANYIWDRLMDLEDDSDGDGRPDDVLAV